jgi:hypothetical protein
MLLAFLYSVVRLLLDVVDVRLRVRNPEAELSLLRHQLRVVRRQIKDPIWMSEIGRSWRR